MPNLSTCIYKAAWQIDSYYYCLFGENKTLSEAINSAEASQGCTCLAMARATLPTLAGWIGDQGIEIPCAVRLGGWLDTLLYMREAGPKP